MAPKKKTKHYSEDKDEIDLRQLSRQVWYNRKLIFFGTIFVALISTFILFLNPILIMYHLCILSILKLKQYVNYYFQDHHLK